MDYGADSLSGCVVRLLPTAGNQGASVSFFSVSPKLQVTLMSLEWMFCGREIFLLLECANAFLVWRR